jgi:hypothetical protein
MVQIYYKNNSAIVDTLTSRAERTVVSLGQPSGDSVSVRAVVTQDGVEGAVGAVGVGGAGEGGAGVGRAVVAFQAHTTPSRTVRVLVVPCRQKKTNSSVEY